MSTRCSRPTPVEFDVVTAFDIVEHTFDPASFLDDIGRVLAPGGLLVLSTPDTGHWLRPLMRSRWPMLQPDQHTFLFSRSAMRTLLVSRGYEPLVIKTERKVLTIDYLFGQLRQTNPTLAQYLDRAKRLLPSGGPDRDLAVNIGEMLVCARKRPAAEPVVDDERQLLSAPPAERSAFRDAAPRKPPADQPDDEEPYEPGHRENDPDREGSRLVAKLDPRDPLWHGDASKRAIGRVDRSARDRSPSPSSPGSTCPGERADRGKRLQPEETPSFPE